MTDEPLIEAVDASVTSLLQKVAEDGSVADRIDAIKVASGWLAQRLKLAPVAPAKGGAKFDRLRDQFHGGASVRRGSRAKAANGAASILDEPPGDDPGPSADA